MSKDNTSSSGKTDKNINRRRLLQMSGAAAAASLPLAMVGTSGASNTNAIDESDPDDIRRFALEALTADSKDEAEQLWMSLDRNQAAAVAQYIHEHSETEIGEVKATSDNITITTESGTQSAKQVEPENISPFESDAAESGSSDVTTNDTRFFLNRVNIPVRYRFGGGSRGVVLYRMNHVMGYGIIAGGGMYFDTDYSYGNGSAPYWEDKRQSYFDHTAFNSVVSSYITREYQHNPPMICNRYYAKVDLRGFRNGNFEVIRTNGQFGQHSC